MMIQMPKHNFVIQQLCLVELFVSCCVSFVVVQDSTWILILNTMASSTLCGGRLERTVGANSLAPQAATASAGGTFAA